MIQENSNVKQWKYIPSKEAPADHASNRMTFKNFPSTDGWSQCPEFLWKSHLSWDASSVSVLLQLEDPELKKQVKINKIVVEDGLSGSIEETYSCCLKLKQNIELILKWEIN